MDILMTIKSGFWPWLFDHQDDIGVFFRFNGNDLIRWYAVCLLSGMLLSLYRAHIVFRKLGKEEDYFDNFFLSVIPIAIVGSRLWYVISCPSQFMKGSFIKSFLAIIGFNNGKFALAGLAIQGGVVAGVLWAIFYFNKIKKRYPFGFLFDIAMPSVLIGQIFGRWGNFFNGEVYGITVNRSAISWWIPKFIINYCTGTGANSQVGLSEVHIPLFYIEGLINTVGFFLIGVLLFYKWKKGRRPFQIGFLYFIWYGTVRLLLEPLRESEYIMQRTIFGISVRTSIFMSVLYIIIGVVGFIVFGILTRKKTLEEGYVRQDYENMLLEKQKKLDEEREAKIQAKKKEILARKNSNG